jgi:hypothetical protein
MTGDSDEILQNQEAESAGNKETGESDRGEVFHQGDPNIFYVQRGDQFSPDFVKNSCQGSIEFRPRGTPDYSRARHMIDR